MKTDNTVPLTRAEILSALDYLNYIDTRLEAVEDACGQMCHEITRLQHWLERLSKV